MHAWYLWNSHAVHEHLGGLFQALRLGGLSSCACFVEWVHKLDVLQDQQEVLNSFWLALFQQVVLVLPLQRAHV